MSDNLRCASEREREREKGHIKVGEREGGLVENNKEKQSSVLQYSEVVLFIPQTYSLI